MNSLITLEGVVVSRRLGFAVVMTGISLTGLVTGTAAAAPSWAPPKPVDPVWANGSQQVWDAGWQHWGVWMNGVFIPTF
jgi:hypothetical protein